MIEAHKSYRIYRRVLNHEFVCKCEVEQSLKTFLEAKENLKEAKEKLKQSKKNLREVQKEKNKTHTKALHKRSVYNQMKKPDEDETDSGEITDSSVDAQVNVH